VSSRKQAPREGTGENLPDLTVGQQPHAPDNGPIFSAAGAGAGTPPHPGETVLAFEVAGQNFGLAIADVVRIAEMVVIDRLPAAPAFLAGVIDYCGQVIPIVDMRRRFGLPAVDYTLRTPIIISQLAGRIVGLVVDGVSRVVDLQPEQIARTDQIVAAEWLSRTRFLAGVARLNDGLLLLLDGPALFSGQEAQAVARAQSPRRRPAGKG